MTEFRLPWTPRDWQRPLLADKAPRIVAVVHRRAGKSDCILWRGLRKAATYDRPHMPRQLRNLENAPVRVVHVLPFAVQWDRTGLWDRLQMAANTIPGAKVEKGDRRIVFPGGGVYQTGGMDRPQTWRGGYADELIEDEADDVTGDSLDTVIEPMLADYEGVRIKVGTPKGNGRLKAAYDAAAITHGWSRYLLPYTETGVLGAQDKERNPEGYERALARLRTDMTEEEFAQELECSFDQPNAGTYYGKQMQAAEAEKRIGDIPHDPRLPVVTAWDLGVDDATAIWFVQAVPGGFHVIDYEEHSGEGADFYARILKAKPYAYDRHHLPHDVEQRSWNDARSRRDVLESLGVRPIRTGKQLPVADGINAVRMILPRCKFDDRKTLEGRKALAEYKREWNPVGQTWRANPLHNWASHGADAFREFAMNGAEWRDPARKRQGRQADNDYDPMKW